MTLRNVFVLLMLTIFAWGCGSAPVKKAHPLPGIHKEISLTVRPRWVMGAFGTFKALVKIEPNDDNRLLIFEYDGTKYSRSFIQLDELNSDQLTFDFWMKDVPSGQYTIQATLVRKIKGDLVYFSDNTEVAVCGPGMDVCVGAGNAKF